MEVWISLTSSLKVALLRLIGLLLHCQQNTAQTMLVTFTFLCIISVVLLTNAAAISAFTFGLYVFFYRGNFSVLCTDSTRGCSGHFHFRGVSCPQETCSSSPWEHPCSQVGSETTVPALLLSALLQKLLRMLLMTKTEGWHRISWQQLWAGAAAATAQHCMVQTGSNTEPGNSQSELYHPAPDASSRSQRADKTARYSNFMLINCT